MSTTMYTTPWSKYLEACTTRAIEEAKKLGGKILQFQTSEQSGDTFSLYSVTVLIEVSDETR